MKKRLSVFVMVFVVLVTSIIGFKSQGVTAAVSSEKAAQVQIMKSGTFNYSFGLTSTEKLLELVNTTVDESMQQVVADLIQSEYQIKMTIESDNPSVINYKIGMKKADSDQLIGITTLIMKDNIYYINMAEFKEWLNSFRNPTMSMIAGIFTTKEEYLKLTEEDMNLMLGIYEDTEAADTNMIMKEYIEYDEAYTKLTVMFNENFEKAIKDISPAPIYREDGKVTLNINTGNYEAVVNNVCRDIIKNKELYFDQIISIFENLPSYEKYVSEWKADKQGALNSIQEFCDELMTTVRENKLKDTDGLNFTLETTVSGTKENLEIANNINFYIKLTEADMELGFYLKSNAKEEIADEDRVIVPEKSVTIDEYINSTLSE